MVALLFAIVSICLFGYVLHSHSGIFREFEAALLSVEWMLLVCLAVWCGTFLLLTFSLKDLPLIGLLLIAIVAFSINYAASSRAADAVILLTGVTLGKSAFVLLRRDKGGYTIPEIANRKSPIVNFLVGLVMLLAFSSWWHLDMSANFYHGPRWMGLWDNPNIYGMLMGAGGVLAIGLLAQMWNAECGMRNEEKQKAKTVLQSAIGNWKSAILLVAAGMMGVGLLFSYSRGAWLGTAIGLLYLAKVHGRFKWRFVLPVIFVVAAAVFFFWNATSDTGPWYLKRLDLSRASAQHRVAAWKAGFEMMRDHPFGVGWNNTLVTYEKGYSPPDNGAAAITTNDYLMLGTQLGLPGLICFVVYVGLCLGASASRRQVGSKAEPAGETPALPAIYRAGALVMLVAFWFDGGLFKLATASVFWILLELSQVRNPPSPCYGATSAECGMRNNQMRSVECEVRNITPNSELRTPNLVSPSSNCWSLLASLASLPGCCCRFWPARKNGPKAHNA